jgi:hypothetical protein
VFSYRKYFISVILKIIVRFVKPICIAKFYRTSDDTEKNLLNIFTFQGYLSHATKLKVLCNFNDDVPVEVVNQHRDFILPY